MSRVLINTRFLGRIQVFTKWGPIKGATQGSPPVGDPWEILEFLVLGNAISGILRQSQRVLFSGFLKLKLHIFPLKYNRAVQNDIMLFANWEVLVVKNCDRGPENAA